MRMKTNIPREDRDGGKISPACTLVQGMGKLPLHIPFPVDIPITDGASR
ncbi:hypothetical protein L195_g062476, partial [Trifolium pratense]